MGWYRTILAAVDGSRDADAALDHAAMLARDQHARLIVLTVIPAPPQVTVPGSLLAADGSVDDIYAAILRHAVDRLPADIGIESRLARGRPAQRILEIALESACDLVVMGFHGHGRLHHALMGSVSDSVLLGSDRPVLLMRAGDARPALAQKPCAPVDGGAAQPARPASA
jgi:nucleotide-binding universal stress UspA family protein